MKSIMEALYNGKIIPWERRARRSDEHKEIERCIECERRHFTKEMSPEECMRFEQLENLYLTANCCDEADLYSHAFSLGMLLMFEALERGEDMIGE